MKKGDPGTIKKRTRQPSATSQRQDEGTFARVKPDEFVKYVLESAARRTRERTSKVAKTVRAS